MSYGKVSRTVYDALEDNCIINAWVSWGKTFTGLAIAGKLGQKTLVVTHTVPLRNQWAKEVEKVYGFSPGIIGSGRFELIALLLLAILKLCTGISRKSEKEFGTIILDEMHHVSSPTFSKIIDTSHARYKLDYLVQSSAKMENTSSSNYFSPNIFKPPKKLSYADNPHIIGQKYDSPTGPIFLGLNESMLIANNDEYRHSVAMLASAYATGVTKYSWCQIGFTF